MTHLTGTIVLHRSDEPAESDTAGNEYAVLARRSLSAGEGGSGRDRTGRRLGPGRSDRSAVLPEDQDAPVRQAGVDLRRLPGGNGHDHVGALDEREGTQLR
jgi:hypothetical protein